MSEEQQSQTDEQVPASKASGYEETPPTPESQAAGYNKPPTEDKPAEGKPAEKKEFKFTREGHSEKAIELINSFAEAHNLTDAQAEGFATYLKDMEAASGKAKELAAADAKKAQYAQMQKDFQTLKNDKDFGTDIEKSFMEANKVLDLMPEFKKVLTESGKHMEPNLALGLKKLYKSLYAQDGTLVQGGTSGTVDTRPDWDKIYDKKN